MENYYSNQVGLRWEPKEAVKLLRFVSRTCDNHALALLSICYLPGVFAAYLQVPLRAFKRSHS